VEERLSPFALVKALETHITSLIMKFDIDSLPAGERELLRSLKRLVVDVRLDLRDYGMADTKAEQDRLARETSQRLDAFERAIVKAGELNLFGAVDVAHLSAQTQQLMAHM
jgi:hypothetical protein